MSRWNVAGYFWVGAAVASYVAVAVLRFADAPGFYVFVFSALPTLGYMITLLLQSPIQSRHHRRLCWISTALGVICVPSMLLTARFNDDLLCTFDSSIIQVVRICFIMGAPVIVPTIVSALLLKCIRWIGWLPAVPSYPACNTCGYNLTGNVSGICPECGSPAPVSAEEAHQGPTRSGR